MNSKLVFQQVKVPGRLGNRTVIQHEDAYINTPITFREPSATNCFQNHFSRVHLARHQVQVNQKAANSVIQQSMDPKIHIKIDPQ
jgi:hypothetical protein